MILRIRKSKVAEKDLDINKDYCNIFNDNMIHIHFKIMNLKEGLYLQNGSV